MHMEPNTVMDMLLGVTEVDINSNKLHVPCDQWTNGQNETDVSDGTISEWK